MVIGEAGRAGFWNLGTALIFSRLQVHLGSQDFEFYRLSIRFSPGIPLL